MQWPNENIIELGIAFPYPIHKWYEIMSFRSKHMKCIYRVLLD